MDEPVDQLLDKLRGRLGAELRDWRLSANLSRKQAAEALDYSASTICRIENGQVGVHPRTVRDLLQLYGVNEANAQELVELARTVRNGSRTR